VFIRVKVIVVFRFRSRFFASVALGDRLGVLRPGVPAWSPARSLSAFSLRVASSARSMMRRKCSPAFFTSPAERAYSASTRFSPAQHVYRSGRFSRERPQLGRDPPRCPPLSWPGPRRGASRIGESLISQVHVALFQVMAVILAEIEQFLQNIFPPRKNVW
jgi:hypothetical protein